MANKLIQHGGAAAATAAGGPIAGAAWEIGYPIVENWLTGGSGQDQAAAQQQAGMADAARRYDAYRQPAQLARQQALGNQLSAYGGAENAMRLMYGTAYDPRNYAPNLGKNPLLTSGAAQTGGAPSGASGSPFTSADSQAFYNERKDKEQVTPGDILTTAMIPGAGVTQAIAGRPDPSNKELFNTSGQSQQQQDLNAWMNAYMAQNGGHFPPDSATAAWLEAHGRAEEAQFYRQRNRGSV